jgi:hypothetical protein
MFVTLGCGFQRTVPLGDGGDTADLSGADLAGADLAGVVHPRPDLGGADLLGAPLGPGPLGALPTGYCCTSDDECRWRTCLKPQGGSDGHCADRCFSDDVCTAFAPGYRCDTSTERCVSTTAPAFNCLPQDRYIRGQKPLGACCQHGFLQSGQECAGGHCQSTGHSANPFYCTQGCTGACPAGYLCAAGFCWNAGSLSDPMFMYTCQ